MTTGSTPLVSDRGEGENLELLLPPRDVTITALGDPLDDGSIAIQITWKSPSPDSVVDLYTVCRSYIHLCVQLHDTVIHAIIGYPAMHSF